MKRGKTNWRAGLEQIGPLHTPQSFRLKFRRKGGLKAYRKLGCTITRRVNASMRRRRPKITLPKITFEGVS